MFHGSQRRWGQILALTGVLMTGVSSGFGMLSIGSSDENQGTVRSLSRENIKNLKTDSTTALMASLKRYIDLEGKIPPAQVLNQALDLFTNLRNCTESDYWKQQVSDKIHSMIDRLGADFKTDSTTALMASLKRYIDPEGKIPPAQVLNQALDLLEGFLKRTESDCYKNQVSDKINTIIANVVGDLKTNNTTALFR